MIGLLKDSHDQTNGERFTLTIQDPVDRTSGYATDSFPNLTEHGVRELLQLIESDACADRRIQNARVDFRAGQQELGPAFTLTCTEDS